MRLSELGGKEIVDLNNGERMGVISHSDLEINPETGEINAIILPESSFWGFRKRRHDIVIAWKSVYKIGPDMILVEFSPKNQLVGRE